MSRQKLYTLRTKRAFELKQKAFLIIFQGLSDAKNCLSSQSAPLSISGHFKRFQLNDLLSQLNWLTFLDKFPAALFFIIFFISTGMLRHYFKWRQDGIASGLLTPFQWFFNLMSKAISYLPTYWRWHRMHSRKVFFSSFAAFLTSVFPIMF